MEPAKTTFRLREGIVPNPKARLRDQVREVARFKHFSGRVAGGGEGQGKGLKHSTPQRAIVFGLRIVQVATR